MSNRAAQELAALSNMQQDVVEVEDAASALQRVTPDPGAQQMDDGDTAKFGTAEAIATAAFASLLLGPVGGILVGGAQGWLKKKSDQAMLDQMAGEKNVLSDASDVYSDQLNTFRASATNPNDLEQVGVMQTTLDAAREFMGSADPALRSQGVSLMASVDQEMNSYASRQETQRIANDTMVKNDKRQLGLDDYARYEGMQTDFDAQSAPYLARKQAADTALAALQGGNPAQLHSAMILFNKTLDPNSAVLGEERTAITEMGTLWDKAYNTVASALATGQQLNAQQRREMGEAILTITDSSTQYQLQREARFQERAADDLAPEYIDRFSLVTDTPASAPLDIPADVRDDIASIPGATAEGMERLGQEVVKAGDKATSGVIRATEATRDYLQGAGEAISNSAVDANKALLESYGVRPSGSRPTN